MTRVLSDLLGAREPVFQQSLRRLESLAGHPGADIRLSTAMQQSLRLKLRDLNLDPADTTGPELYAALGQRLQSDETRFAAALQHRSGTSDDPIAQVARALKDELDDRICFAIKSTVAKKIIRANLPRKTMKLLGYRSAESMLKHESAASLFAAAWLVESNIWTRRIISGYSKLQAGDFEVRPVIIEHPSSQRWQKLSETIVAARKHHILKFTELGAVILLPLPAKQPPLPTLTAAVLTCMAVNEVCAAGTFLKLQQMHSNFGTIFQQVVTGEPMLPAENLDEPLSWHSLHQYFARLSDTARTDLFEPVVAAEELVWEEAENILSRIEPALSFWQHTAFLGMITNGKAVSCNLADALLSHCNQLPFENRVVQHFKKSLRTEILLQYLSHDKLERVIVGGVQGRLAPEMAGL